MISYNNNNNLYQGHLFHLFGDPALPLPFPRITSIINTEASSDTFIIVEQAEIVLNDISDDYYMTVRGPEQYNSIGYYLPGEIIFQGNIHFFIRYCGLSIARKYILAKYSPIIPIANNCTPEKIAIIDAKNGNPCTGVPTNRYCTTTYIRIDNPKNAKINPSILAI